MDTLSYTLPFLRPGVRSPVTHKRTGDHSGDLCLPEQALLSLQGDRRGTTVACRAGVVWITQEGDPQDHILSASKEFRIDRAGHVVIQALESACLRLHEES